MPKPLGHKTRDTFEVKRFFFTHTKKHRGRAEVLTIEDFVLGVGDIIFGSLGDVVLNVGQDFVAAAGFPRIFSGGG